MKSIPLNFPLGFYSPALFFYYINNIYANTVDTTLHYYELFSNVYFYFFQLELLNLINAILCKRCGRKIFVFYKLD